MNLDEATKHLKDPSPDRPSVIAKLRDVWQGDRALLGILGQFDSDLDRAPEGLQPAEQSGNAARWSRRPALVSATDHFTVEAVLGGVQSKIPRALPGVFTAVGLLGTFAGITMGLVGIELDASGERLEAIGRLMAGMSTAFLTSILGITWSVWWLFEFRHAEHRLALSLSLFLASAEAIFEVEQPHETLVKIRDAVTGEDAEGIGGFGDTIGEINEGVRGLNEMAEGIKGDVQGLGEDLASALEPLLERHVAAHLKDLNTEISERQQEALERMVQQFQDTLVSSVGKRLEEFSRALRDASDHQVSAAEKLGRFFDRLEEVGKTQTELLEGTRRAVDDFKSGVTGLTEARDAIQQSTNAARVTMESARNVIDECRGLVESQRESSKTHADALTDLQSNLRHLVHDLADKVGEFRALSAEKLGEVFATFDSEMAKVTDHLGGTLADLRDVASELLEMTRMLPGSIGNLRDSVGDVGQAVRDQRESVDAISDSLGQANTKIAGHIEVFANQVGRSIAELRNACDQVSEMAKEVGGSNTVFASGAKEIGDHLQKVATRTDENSKRTVEEMARLRSTAESASVRVESVADKVVTSIRSLDEMAASGSDSLGLVAQRVKELLDLLRLARTEAASGGKANQVEIGKLHEAISKTGRATKELAADVKEALAQMGRTVESNGKESPPPDKNGEPDRGQKTNRGKQRRDEGDSPPVIETTNPDGGGTNKDNLTQRDGEQSKPEDPPLGLLAKMGRFPHALASKAATLFRRNNPS